MRKLKAFKLPISSRVCAIAAFNSRLRSALVVFKAASVSKRFAFSSSTREVWIRILRLLAPAIAREGLKSWRRASNSGGNAIGIGAIGVHIHVGLEEDGFAARLRMFQLQHRLAVVKIVSRQELIQSPEVCAERLQLRLVKLREKRRDRLRFKDFRKAR